MLIDGYDTLLLDLDGVVYLGPHPIPAATESLKEAARSGIRLAYCTNNASRTPRAIAEHLTALGAPASVEDVVTSAQAAARLIAERVPAGSPVLVVGGMGLRTAVRQQGLRPVTTALDHPVAVVEGFTPDLSYSLLREGALAVRQGALFVAANADSTMPTSRGEVPGNGSLTQVIAHATGATPIVAGKPERPMHRESILRTGSQRPLVVGDRLDTDIEGATAASVDSLLVLTGVATPLDILTAGPRHRPTYIAADLSELHQPYPDITVEAGQWTCAAWTATWKDNSLSLEGHGDPVNALRAASAATWASVGHHSAAPAAVTSALELLSP
ncbi:HAD-IIA family hydrolase [Sinosporangium album]